MRHPLIGPLRHFSLALAHVAVNLSETVFMLRVVEGSWKRCVRTVHV